MKSQYDLTIYILAHNRPELLVETLKSIFNQTFQEFNVVVSDNSDNSLVEEKLKKEKFFTRIDYKFRNCAADHLNVILAEVSTPYFMMFHDDDVMLPDMVRQLYLKIKGSDYVAVACNAYKMKDTADQKYGKMLESSTDIIIDNTDQLFMYYFGEKGITPFPAYMYSSKKIKELKIIYEASQYSDATWIAGLLRYGSIYWIAEPLMNYRVHSQQNSYTMDWDASKLLLNYFLKNSKSELYQKEIRKVKREYRKYALKDSRWGKMLQAVMENVNCLRIKGFVRQYQKTYIYGCGKVGIKCVKFFEKNGIPVSGFVVTNMSGLASVIEGYPVFEYSEELMETENCCVIIGLGIALCKEVLTYPQIQKYRDRFLVFSKWEV